MFAAPSGLGAIMRIVWWTLLGLFVVSTCGTLTHRMSGYTNASIENDRYFASYRSTRYEVTKEEYERVKFRDPLTFDAGMAMIFSACGLGGLEMLRRSRGRDRATGQPKPSREAQAS
jgi:hypothetical protein